jgi:hypothetical protein
MVIPLQHMHTGVAASTDLAPYVTGGQPNETEAEQPACCAYDKRPVAASGRTEHDNRGRRHAVELRHWSDLDVRGDLRDFGSSVAQHSGKGGIRDTKATSVRRYDGCEPTIAALGFRLDTAASLDNLRAETARHHVRRKAAQTCVIFQPSGDLTFLLGSYARSPCMARRRER